MSMNKTDRALLEKIQNYANLVMPNIDPQKTPVSYQLAQLKPIMEEIGNDEGLSIEDVFIRYMDLASTYSLEEELKFQDSLKLINE